MKEVSLKEKNALIAWYQENHRKLPWRKTQDPYVIWISEVMLQQTTVKAVLPYFERFLEKFPNVQILASASLEDVYEYWSGLGYYSRARSLHKAAQLLKDGFPKTHQELLELPGFGPYTARAVASFAFHDPTGVLDGNVIRFLSRYHLLKLNWWEPKQRKILQKKADEWVTKKDSAIMNQALIEIGATICTAQNPSCLLCPLASTCIAYQTNTQDKLPLKKPRREYEIWLWEPKVLTQNLKNKTNIALEKNNYAPFLKGQWIFPGTVRHIKSQPKDYDYKHTITHHQIYVKLKKSKSKKASKDFLWVQLEQIKKISPVSLIQKALPYIASP